MAAIGGSYPTMLDVMKIKAPDGGTLKVAEVLAQRNDILQDAPYMEGNLTTGHRIAAQHSLPSLTWRKINQGIAASKGTDVQVDETCGLLEGRSVVDAELVRLNGGAEYRMKNDQKFTTAMSNEIATALFYHSTKTDPERILGLSPRYDSAVAGQNQDNVVPAMGASGDEQSSMWFITWGPDTTYLVYPKGTAGGMETKDMGLDYENDPTDSTNPFDKFLAWRTHFFWRVGLVVEDWRYTVRICNIDSSVMLAKTEGSMGVELVHAMIKAYNRIRDFNSGRTVIYCNRQTRQWIDQQIVDKSNVYFTPGEWGGRPVSMFRGLPILICDALDITESPVTVS